MFYCDFCRAIYKWPRSAGWPHMGVSRGKCKMCDTVQYCHDVPSSALPLQHADPITHKECTECGQKRAHRPIDYVCMFCRGEVELPNPHKELAESWRLPKVRVDDILKHYLDNMPPER